MALLFWPRLLGTKEKLTSCGSNEHERLESQHKVLTAICHNKILHAPVSKAKQILDVGCGTGCVTTWLAETFPAATVTGLDLSPVPKLREQPANVRYVQGNILDQTPRDWISEGGERAVLGGEGVFDIIFSRLLLAGMTNWEGYIAKQFSLLQPGGWAECHELCGEVFGPEGQIVEWAETSSVQAKTAKEGMDFSCGRKIKGWMENAGFNMVEAQVYAVPMGGEGQATKELREIGDWFMKNTLGVMDVAVRRSMVGEEAEEIERVLKIRKAVAAKANGWYTNFYVTYGRKPE